MTPAENRAREAEVATSLLVTDNDHRAACVSAAKVIMASGRILSHSTVNDQVLRDRRGR